MKTLQLSNGQTIPIIGTGTNTFGKVDRNYHGEINHDTTQLDTAIRAGYRLIDTAISYRNESVIGDAVKKSGLDRSEFFITSKIPGEARYTETEEAIHNAVQASLQALQTNTIDLYLIHHPWDNNEDMLRVWQVLETYVKSGILKNIGVSNYMEDQLQYLLNHASIKPVVNQIESHPGKWQHELIAFCLDNNVIPQAWGPLSRTTDEAKKILQPIADKYKKTWAQVVLNYQVGRGVVVIPKSHDALRQAQNLDIFDFVLTQEETHIIASL